MRANLHLHSRYSDGTRTPEEIVRAAMREKLGMIALTDHDSMGGTARMAAACASADIRFIPACEVDVYDESLDYDSEILAYFPGADPEDGAPATRALIAASREGRRRRLELLLAAARSLLGRPDLDFGDMEGRKCALLGGGCGGDEAVLRMGSCEEQVSYGKVDFYEYLKEKNALGEVDGFKAFRKSWFDSGRIPVRKIAKPTVADLVKAVHSDGGHAVVPHIGHIWDDEPALMQHGKPRLAAVLAGLRGAGVDGIELYWYGTEKKTHKINEIVEKAAASFGFFFTYGSDCHGPGSGKHTIDKFWGKLADFPPGR